MEFLPGFVNRIDEQFGVKDSSNRSVDVKNERTGESAIQFPAPFAAQFTIGCEKTMTPGSVPFPSPAGGALERFPSACRVLEDAIQARAFPGCAFGVLADGQGFQGALGRFTYEPESPAVHPETVFDVASLTKVVATTAVAMLLYQRGQLDLDTPLGDLLPGFVIGREPGDASRRVTLRHLLAHNSGLPGYAGFFRSAATPYSLFRACLELRLEAEPGARAEYSDPGFILLGQALEVPAGEHLPGWVRREVFAPLGLSAIGFCPVQELRAAIPPTEEDRAFRHRRIQGEVQDENAWVLKGAAGHAGLFSSVPDLLRFADAILRAGMAGETDRPEARLFDRTTVEYFARRQGPEGSSRALGWDTPSGKSSSGRHFSQHSIGHLGYSGCSLWIDLEAEVAIALLTNRTWPDRSSQLIREVRPAFHDAVREAL
jgi:serine-type D-Ala-D-Ala carboxypeptidase